MKKIFVISTIVLVIILLITITFAAYERTAYEKYAGMELASDINEIKVDYMNECINISDLDKSSIITQLQYRNREIYFKKINLDKCISITSTNGTVIKIFPKDDDSVYLQLAINKGLNLQYTLYGTNFNNFLDTLYKISGNNIFKV